jgi:hypothetical protein
MINEGANRIFSWDFVAKERILPVELSAVGQCGRTKTTASIARARHDPNVFKIFTEFSISKTV